MINKNVVRGIGVPNYSNAMKEQSAMYLTNKYTNWYYNIITQARLRVNNIEYNEKHHIIPKSLGGTNDLNNLVRLTAREHFICHLLLTKMTEGTNKSKMARAAWLMASARNKYQRRQKINARTYERLRKQYSILSKGVPKSEEHKAKLSKPKTAEHKRKLSDAKKGKTYGYTHSEETKRKISKSHKNRIYAPISDERKKKQSAALKGRKQTAEHIEKRARARRGIPRTEETKQKIREARAKQIISEETKLKMSEAQKQRHY